MNGLDFLKQKGLQVGDHHIAGMFVVGAAQAKDSTGKVRNRVHQLTLAQDAEGTKGVRKVFVGEKTLGENLIVVAEDGQSATISDEFETFDTNGQIWIRNKANAPADLVTV